MKPIRIIPQVTNVDFISWHKIAFVVSLVLILASVALLVARGLNFGIDFRGGILLEVRAPVGTDIGTLRSDLGGLGLGETSIQEFGEPTEFLIRVQRQEGDEASQIAAIETIRSTLGDSFDYRRTEFVGPTVGGELITAGITAVLLATAAILLYIWVRFEWQFGLGAIIAITHDVATTMGLFSLIQFEFNLATVAALLTIAGYSINDTVVVYDRVRENLRKYKKTSMPELLNRSLNETLARTLMTSITTLLALVSLYMLGGPIIRDFAFALIWGVLIGTYSSVFVATPLLLYLSIRRDKKAAEKDKAEGQTETADESA
ncbi:MAG: protein translocase subunit SecF [Pseudomonadota bacterium]